jgi:hypothetical protein
MCKALGLIPNTTKIRDKHQKNKKRLFFFKATGKNLFYQIKGRKRKKTKQ